MRRSSLVVPACFLALLTGVFAAELRPFEFDGFVSERARAFGNANPTWVNAWRWITRLGDSPVILAAVAGTTAVVLVLWRRGYAVRAPHRTYADLAALIALVPTATWLSGTLLRQALGRPRPVDSFVVPTGGSFPSGHTMGATAVAVTAVLLLWPWLARRGRVVLLVAAVLLPALVGCSRVALLAHWPSDVVGGWLWAVAVAPLILAGVSMVLRRHAARHAARRAESSRAESSRAGVNP